MKTTMRLKLTANEKIPHTYQEGPEPRTQTTSSAGEDVEQRELALTAGGNAKCCVHSLVALTHPPTIRSSNCVTQQLPNDLKTCIHPILHTRMFTAALFIISKTRKQPRCLSRGEWMSKMWCIQTMEYYSVLQRKKLSNHEKTWRKSRCLLSERSQSEKGTYCMIPAMTFQKRQNDGGSKTITAGWG